MSRTPPIQMHSSTLAVLATAALLAACGSAEPSLDGAAAAEGAQSAPVRDAPAGARQTSETPAGVSAVPITGDTIDVKLVRDERGYRFEPQRITAKSGDGVRFIVVSGGPHEIQFDVNTVPAPSLGQLRANMPNASNGRSPLLTNEAETWTISLGGLVPGRYPFVSTPRLPQGMKGEIEIR